jgi:serine/threonine kinase PknH
LKIRRWAVMGAVAATCLVLSGCAHTVDGTPRADPRPTAVTDVSQLDVLLLREREVEAITGGRGLEITETYDAISSDTGGQTVSDPACVTAMFNSTAAGYHGSGYVALAGSMMQEPGKDYEHYVDQAVVQFVDARTAQNFVESVTRAWQPCAGRPITISYPAAPSEKWLLGAPVTEYGITAIKQSESAPDSWSCQHAIAARSNVVIDVQAVGFDVTDEAVRIVASIAERIAPV